MGRERKKAKMDPFIAIPRDVMKSEAFKSLPAVYRALYLDLRRQATPWQNGKITASDSTLEAFGWSHSTIHKGLTLLIEHGLLERTRRGGLGNRGKKTSLYAFTDMAVEPDERIGIRGRAPTFVYRGYTPRNGAGTVRRSRKIKVHAVDCFGASHASIANETVHGMDAERNEGACDERSHNPASPTFLREKIAA